MHIYLLLNSLSTVLLLLHKMTLQISVKIRSFPLTGDQVAPVVSNWLAHGKANRLQLTVSVGETNFATRASIAHELRAITDVTNVIEHEDNNDAVFKYMLHTNNSRILELKCYL